MKLQQILSLSKEATITVAGAGCIYCAISFGGEIGRLQKVAPPIRVGMHMSLPGESTTGRRRDLIVVGSESCRFSRESIEFDHKLLLAANSFGLPVHIIAPTKSAAAWYSSQLSLSTSLISVHSLVSLGIRGTPTVILRDESGVVQGLWEGFLPLSEQHAVLLRVGEKKHILEKPHFEDLTTHQVGAGKAGELVPSKTPGPVAEPKSVVEIDESSLYALGLNSTVIDLRERDSFVRTAVTNEMNIPFPELDVRARIELKPDVPVIVDCSTSDVGECDLAALKLVSLKFMSVSVLDRGARGRACGITLVSKS